MWKRFVAVPTLTAMMMLGSLVACSISSSDDSNAVTTCDGGSCGEVDGSITDGAITGDGSIASDASRDASDASVDPLTCDPAVKPGDRLVTIVNACASQTVVVGINGGYIQDCGAGNTCPAGSTCSTARAPAGCFWDFPTPKCGKPVLQTGDAVTYELTAAPEMVGSVNIKWSGNLYAATHCDPDGSNCKTGQCATSVGGKTVVGPCTDGIGPQGPATLAEFTFAPNGPDFYDVSAINGVNVPMSMTALGGAVASGDPYSCQSAGSNVASSTGLQECTWAFDPHVTLDSASTDQTTLLRAVAAGGTACTTDGDCAGTDRCGTAVTFGGNTVTRTCGTPVGYWTADELCVYTNGAAGEPLSCTTAVSGQGTKANLYGCDGVSAGSCYNSAANATCCGCPNWSVGGKTLLLTPGFQCYSTNPQWASIAEPWAAFAKNACPTAYSFPFDDPTSTFTCATPGTSATTPNSTRYVITLCPGGESGN